MTSALGIGRNPRVGIVRASSVPPTIYPVARFDQGVYRAGSKMDELRAPDSGRTRSQDRPP
jgi:hypothetical protein